MPSVRYTVCLVSIFILVLHATGGESGPSIKRMSTPTHPAFRTCNEQVCASRISACQLMRACKCELPECPCCADCTRCLGSLWLDCCDCLGLCLAHISRALPLHEISSIGELASPIPSLFNALSYGSNLAVVFVSRPQSTVMSPTKAPNANVTSIGPAVVAVPTRQTGFQAGLRICKVAFFDNCGSRDSCRGSCQLMGASRFQWFHNGCCQCVGNKCVDYGGLQSLCKNCMH